MKPRAKKLFWMIPVGIMGITLFVFIGGQIVMRLWNWLLPPLFHWPQITFWEALGLLILCRILFGGFHGHGGGPGWRMRRRMQERTIERWEKMTPEERERFRQGLRARCGGDTGNRQQATAEPKNL